MDYQLMLMLIAVFLAYLISATFGFGDALILLPILSIFIDIEVGIIFTGFWGFPQAIQQVIKYRAFLDKHFLWIFLPTVIPGIFLGIWLIIYLESVWLQIVIACFIIGYTSYNFFTMKRKKEKFPHNLNKPSLLIGGMIYGTVSSWVGTPGPVSIIYLEYSGHHRESFIANNTAIVVLAGIFKLSLYLINDLFPVDFIGLFVGGVILCLIATKLGHMITPKIPIDKFQVIINAVLMIVGIRMLLHGFSVI